MYIYIYISNYLCIYKKEKKKKEEKRERKENYKIYVFLKFFALYNT